GYKLSEGPGTFDYLYDYYSEDYGRFGYVDAGMVPDFIGTNENEFYIQYNVITLSPSCTVTLPTETWLEENGAGDAITFTFDKIPQAELIIEITPTGAIDAGAGAGAEYILHILPDSSALIPKTVSWNVPDDALVEDITGNSVGVHADPATWGMYSTMIDFDFDYTITDNELGVFMWPSEIDLIEGTSSDTIYAHINMIPDADVEITLTPDLLFDCGFGGLVTPTFNLPAGIAGIEIFKLTASTTNDLYVDETIFTNINLDFNSTDMVMNDFIINPIPLTIIDNDIASFETVAPSSSVSEGVETFDITINLTSAPYNDVTVTAIPNLQIDLGAGPGTPVSITFDADGTIPGEQTFSGIAYDDYLLEGDHTGFVTFSIFTSDPYYSAITIDDIIIDIDDNDAIQGVNVIFTPDIYTEGTSAELSLSLFTNPNEAVTIYATPDAQLNLGAGAGVAVAVVFDLITDATEPQLINIEVVDDYDVEGDHTGNISFSIVTFDPVLMDYDIPSTIINIEDNDEIQGVNVIYPGVDLYVEGTTGLELNLSLFTDPHEVVTIYATPDMELDLGAGFGAAVPFVFDLATDATIPQIINFTIANNYIIEGAHSGTITFSIETTDPVFDGYIINDAIINISDDDEEQDIIITSPAIEIYIEGNTGIPVDISLLSIPNSEVFIYANCSDQLDLGSGPGETIYFLFSADATAMDIQTIHVTIVDDALVEGMHNATVDFTIGTSDPVFTGYTIAPVTFNISDNDEEVAINNETANGFSINPSIGNGVFTIQTGNETGEAELTILNMSGQKIFEASISSGSSVIDISYQPSGKYLAMINNGQVITTRSIQIIE
ncbi:MAG: T9SS type A sorting domain-containing protein, partial [Chitinophagales bacterium]